MLNFLRELVSLSSETRDLPGVEQIQKKVANRLALVGAKTQWLLPEKEGYATSLLASWGGDAPGGVCLISHADTVYATEILQPFHVNEAEGRVYGGGVADNKGGLVIACGAIEKLFSQGILNRIKRPLYFFSSSSEELGSPAFQNFIKEFSPKLDYVLSLEPALPDGSLIKKRRGNRYYSINILGNSVHTGRDLKEAANPIDGLVLLHGIILKLRQKYPSVGASLNGIKSSSFVYNMSSDRIEVTLDTRFDRAADINAFHEELVTHTNKISFTSLNGKNQGSFQLEVVDDCPAFESDNCEEFQVLLEKFSKHEKTEVKLGDGLGAADCSYFARPGLKIVDGLGPRGALIHSPKEYIELKSLENRASALSEYLAWYLTK